MADTQPHEGAMVGIVVDYEIDGEQYREMHYYDEARVKRITDTYLEEGVVRAPTFMHHHYKGEESRAIKPTKLVVLKEVMSHRS